LVAGSSLTTDHSALTIGTRREAGILLKIGLTGGAATGKSTVSEILRGLGAYIIDVDLIGREVVEKGSPCLKEIAAQFGEDMLQPDGSLDRKKMGDLVFADREKLERLNAIVHPAMTARVEEKIKKLEGDQSTRTVVVDAAILIEMGLRRLVDCLWLVWADRKTQVERLMTRDGMSQEKAENIINSQMPMEEKERYADVVIENTGTLQDLETKIRKLWEKR
jgi:dephospho-CoA kinase